MSHSVTPLICPLAGISLLLLSGCAGTPDSGSGLSESDRAQNARYQLTDDAYPDDAPDMRHIRDAEPRYEPYSRGGNGPVYTVRGKSYQVLPTHHGYSATGTASWYGKKFHGYATSNGEIYDMYAMSAAHKTLPLPSYLKVTNPANQKSVVVRVNDRGPFHDDRLIDLSYAAAWKLGFLDSGTARVKLEAVIVEPPEGVDSDISRYFLQLAASSSRAGLKKQQTALELPSVIHHEQGLYKLRLGPFDNRKQAEHAKKHLNNNSFTNAFVIEL